MIGHKSEIDRSKLYILCSCDFKLINCGWICIKLFQQMTEVTIDNIESSFDAILSQTG